MYKDFYGICVGGGCVGVFTKKEDEKIEAGIVPDLVVTVNAMNEADAIVKVMSSDKYMDYQIDCIKERIENEKRRYE
jgi:hypothetical protein